jgi:NADPH:quinone reductase-like Zn-dependent oxidoreductase
MKAWEITGSFGLENLQLVERADPKAPPGHVVVRVRAASLNYRDLMMVRGEYNPKQPLPLVPCSDGAGEVVDVGGGVSSLKLGDRVATMFAQGWQGGAPTYAKIRRTLGGPVDGALATHIVLREDGAAAFPSTWSFAEASTLPCAALTAWSGLVEQAHIKPGDRVLVLGTGGVSTFALQIARMVGATTLCVTSKPEAARALGASDVIDRKVSEDWDKAVRKAWPEGADVVVEVGGAGTLSRSIKSTAVGGTVLVIGVLAGGVDKVNVIPVLMQNIRLQGVIVGHRDGFVNMARAFAASSVKPKIDRTFAFDDARAAFEHLASASHVGKVVVEM